MPVRPPGARLGLLPVLAAVWLLGATAAANEPVAVCHTPPGQPEVRRVLRLDSSAAARHLARHGDTLFREREQCNALDDDCDGRVDEVYPDLGRACFAGLGACAAAGVRECDPQHPEATRCSAQPLEPPEPGAELTCFGGLDEDCDGLTDAEDPDCRFELDRQLPSLVDLPVAIDCCAVSGPGCTTPDYCQPGAEPISPCPSSTGEQMSCLEFQTHPDLNACWSVFASDTPNVGTVAMLSILEEGPVVVEADEVYADNGPKTVVHRRLRDRMLGEGPWLGDPAGVDLYPEVPGIDSWVVRLPVLECQNPGALCSGGQRHALVGALCFEIREIEVFVSSPVIRGRFLCPERDPFLWERCQLGPAFVD